MNVMNSFFPKQCCEICGTKKKYRDDVFWLAKPGNTAYGYYEFARMCAPCARKLAKIRNNQEGGE